MRSQISLQPRISKLVKQRISLQQEGKGGYRFQVSGCRFQMDHCNLNRVTWNPAENTSNYGDNS